MGDPKQKQSTSLTKYLIVNEEFTFKDKGYSKQLLNDINQLRISKEFCDVTLVVKEKEFFCHKIILAAASSYFQTMFTCNLSESSKNRIQIHGIDLNIFNLLLDYAYTSEVTINKTNVQNLLSAANLLQFISIRDACCNFLNQHIDDTNCIGIHCFAEAHNCQDLQNSSKREILFNFLKVVKYEEFLTLEARKLLEFISDDDLYIPKEEDLYEAIILWLNHDYDNRKNDFFILLSQLRMVYMDAYFIHDRIETCKAVQDDPRCQQIINQAKTYQLLECHRYFPLLNTQPRKAFGLLDIIIITGGEDDKVVLRGMESFDPSVNEWRTFSCLPFAISKHGLVTAEGRYLYMAGGEFPDGSTNAGLWRYEFFIDVWQELPMMDKSRTELGFVYLDGFIYAVGGWDSSAMVRLESLEKYDPQASEWQQMAPLPEPLSSLGVTTHRGLLYVLGGIRFQKATNCSNCVYMYDPKKNQWSTLAPMPISKYGACVAVLDNKIYVIGGYTELNKLTNSVECYDIMSNTWISTESEGTVPVAMKEKRGRAAVTTALGKIYVFGGEEDYEKYHDSIEVYDPLLNEWKFVGTLATPRGGLTCLTLKTKLELYIKFKNINIE